MEAVKLEYDYKKNEEKRFYVKGKISDIICPSCKKQNVYKFDPTMGEYLQYPKKNEKTEICFSCNHCDEEIILPMVIKDITINIEIDKTKIYTSS